MAESRTTHCNLTEKNGSDALEVTYQTAPPMHLQTATNEKTRIDKNNSGIGLIP